MEGYKVFKPKYKKALKSRQWTGTLILIVLGLITRIILFWAGKYPSLVEKLYSSTVYPYIAKGLGYISNVVPFSIAESLLVLLALFIMISSLTLILKPTFVLRNIKTIIHYIVRIIVIVYILFYFLWGFNYYRLDYSILASMNEEPATFDELRDLSLKMIKKSNVIRETLEEDENGVLLIDESLYDLGKIANKGFDSFDVGNLNLGGNYGRIKPVILSRFMSYTGISGIYIPFTSEPTINIDTPYHNMLSTISHEIAHQRGFAKEEEANFIAYKANINNPDKRFQYSGYYLAMIHLLNEVYKESPYDYYLLYNELSDAIKRDMRFTREYWASKEGKVEKAMTTMNDNYLKANNQAAGVRSYNQVVKLLLAEYKEQK